MDKAVYIEKRYIEVFKATPDEMDYVLEKAERQANQPWDNVIRVRGLPFKCTSDNLRKFFKVNFISKIFNSIFKGHGNDTRWNFDFG